MKTEVILLCCHGQPLREFPLPAHPLEVGSASGCDVVVHDPEVRERHLLIEALFGSVFVRPLGSVSRTEARPFPVGEPMPLGRYHSLTRLVAELATPELGPDPDGPLTQPIAILNAEPGQSLSLVVGRGSEARRIVLGDRPLSLGTGEGNDLLLHDRSVSSRHARIEPCATGLRIRDLGSRNGTYVDGVAVDLAPIAAGTRIRIGRTELSVVARSRGESFVEGACATDALVAASEPMLEVVEKAKRFASLPWPVLIQGPSGAGKEGIARALHDMGARHDKPFVVINAGGMTRQLIESELFGHERGSFTGAAQRHRGVFEQADGGTLFLDEIGELPLDLQTRLLRVVEHQRLRRVGAEESVEVDVRVVCATHRDLLGMVYEERFRQDLYYRLSLLMIEIPALKERPEDILALAIRFLAQAAEQTGPRRLSEGALEALLSHPWPGNARELRNVLFAAAATSAGAVLTGQEVHRAILQISGRPVPGQRGAAGKLSSEQIAKMVARFGGNCTAAARALGLPRSTLRDRLRQLERPPGEEAEVEEGEAA